MINNPRPDCPYTTADFYYDLPEGLIAQTPAEPRDSSRLMVLNRADGSLTHRTFRDVTEYLQKGDLLVINDSRVIPARMYGVKEESGIEIEVDTRNDCRRRELAQVCCAALILECLQRGLYPSWDAQNPFSVALAEKLGYHFSHTYPAYEVICPAELS